MLNDYSPQPITHLLGHMSKLGKLIKDHKIPLQISGYVLSPHFYNVLITSEEAREFFHEQNRSNLAGTPMRIDIDQEFDYKVIFTNTEGL